MNIIGHVDMDAFFAAVEEREHEWLRGKPIVVGADPKEGKGRGVVSTANYRARAYGIRSAMPISKAWELAMRARKAGQDPPVFLLPDFRLYEKVSNRIMAILAAHSDTIEQASIDEAYFAIKLPESSSRNLRTAWTEVKNLAENIKNEIKAKERLTCSIGIGPNKLIAKIASDFQKPDGLTVISEEEKESFLDPLHIRKLPGIGPKTEAFLASRGVKTVRELKRFSREELSVLLGKWGIYLWERARGIDDSMLEPAREAKSIGREETFPEDTDNPSFLIEAMHRLAELVITDMRRGGFADYKTVSIVVRFSGFETITRARTLSVPANSLETLRFEALKLFMPFLDKRGNPRNKKIRLVGIRIEKLRKVL